MLAGELVNALDPFSKMLDPKAIGVKYRCLELTATVIRAVATFGIMERQLTLPINQSCYVDGLTFIAVMKSLAQEQPLELSSDGNSVRWRCGAAAGKLAVIELLDSDRPKPINRRASSSVWAPGEDFIKALYLGALSCKERTLAGVGLYGVALDFQSKNSAVMSSDRTTISGCGFDSHGLKVPLMIFPPDAIDAMNAVIKTTGAVETGEDTLFYRDREAKLLITTCAAEKLRREVRGIYENFTQGNTAVAMPRAALKPFISRSEALAETKRFTYVNIGVEGGQLKLHFAEGGAETEEYLLINNLEVPDIAGIKLSAEKLSRALSYITEVVLDYAARQVLVLRGDRLTYIIQGRTD